VTIPTVTDGLVFENWIYNCVKYLEKMFCYLYI